MHARRILLTAFGSRGDNQPQICLADELGKRGHSVVMLGGSEFSSLIESGNFKFINLSGSFRAEFAAAAGRRLHASGGNPISSALAMIDIARAHTEDWTREILEHARGADLLIPESASFSITASVAEKLDIPWVLTSLHPNWRTRAFRSPFAAMGITLDDSLLNLLHHDLVAAGMWMAFRKQVDALRKELLGLQPWPFFGPGRAFRRMGRPVNMAISQHVLPKPRDWDAAINMAGFIRMPAAKNWSPPARLVEFLATEQPVIYLGLGSMMVNNPQSIVDTFCVAAKTAGCKLVVSGGWSGLQAAADAGTEVLNIDGIPHDWLFPQMALIAHHCGAGTTASAIAAGRPTFAYPFMADQFFWRDRMQQLGILAGSARDTATVQAVETAIAVARHDREMADRCQQLAQNLNKEDAVANAADFIERQFF